MSSDIGPSWLNFWNAGPLGPIDNVGGGTGPTGPAGPAPEGITGTFYRGIPPQSLTSGETVIDFQLSAPWNSPGYISRTATGQYTVAVQGVYQLEANLVVQPNGSTNPDLLRGVQIWVDRAGNNVQVLAHNGNLPSGLPYTQQCVGTVGLQVGDIVSVRCLNTFTAGPPFVDSFSTLLDLNSFFTWALVKTY
jgi:hypothetical protein